MQKQYFVYILSNFSRTLYIGFTSNLKKRAWEHKQKLADGFTKKYNLTMLVYYEIFNDPLSAIEREKQLKRWSRKKKLALITKMNPTFKDLNDDI